MEQTLSREEKLKILKTLEEDKEFRYAVAGLIGVSEILERLDRIEENLERLWTEIRNLKGRAERYVRLEALNRLARISFDGLTVSVKEEAR